jgi:hypothetical protein
MSFRDIGIIIKKVKLEVDGLEEDDDIKSKSKTTQAIKLFSELQSPVEVAIALDLPADQVQAIYRDYWKLNGMYRLTQIYEEAKYDLDDLLALHIVAKRLGMEKQDIINVLEFVKYNQLRTLQAKVESLRNDIDTLEMQKTKASSIYFRIRRMTGESEKALAQKREEMAHMDHESEKYNNTSAAVS